jgi:hypothetical protein
MKLEAFKCAVCGIEILKPPRKTRQLWYLEYCSEHKYKTKSPWHIDRPVHIKPEAKQSKLTLQKTIDPYK